MTTGLQLFFVFLLGVGLAAFANYAVDRLGWTPRSRSPWRAFPKELVEQGDAPRRTWISRVPIWGWFEIARLDSCKKETSQEQAASRSKRKNGRRATSAEARQNARRYATTPGWESPCFWIRPLLVEILFTALVLWRFLYWRDVTLVDSNFYFGSPLVYWGVETALLWFALCASLVDLDDYIIPDLIILPCACAGLILTTVYPCLIFSPVTWPLDLSGKESTFSVVAFAARILDCREPNFQRATLYVGVALTFVWSFWSFALLDRRFYVRLGFKRATLIFMRRVARSRLTPVVGILWALGIPGIWLVVLTTDAGVFTRLDALTNSFVGLFVGTILIWGVRLVGGSALGVEAMGFGDVILSGALGAFIGWQGAVVVFFLAPFFGLIFGLSRRVVNAEREIPYGPFLCMATLCYVVWRERFNLALEPYFCDPVFVVGVGVAGLTLLAVLLFIVRIGKGLTR